MSAYNATIHASNKKPLIITYIVAEKDSILQKMALLMSSKNANIPDVTLILTVARGCSAEKANIVPPVNSKLMPLQIVVNNLISSH